MGSVYTGITSYGSNSLHSIETVTPQSLPPNVKSYHPQQTSNTFSNEVISFRDLYLTRFNDQTISIGRFAGTVALMWYNSWEDIQLAFAGPKSLQSLKMYLPTYFMRYVQHVVDTAGLSSEVLIAAIIYIARFRTRTNTGVHSQHTSEARILIAALMTANKFLDDVSFTTKTWATIGNIELEELKKMEAEFLNKIDFKLHITPNDWATYNEFVKARVFPAVDKFVQ